MNIFGALLDLELEMFDVLLEIKFLLAAGLDSAVGVRNGAVIVTTEVPGDRDDRLGCQFSAEVHRDLSGESESLLSAAGFQFPHGNSEVFGH